MCTVSNKNGLKLLNFVISNNSLKKMLSILTGKFDMVLMCEVKQHKKALTNSCCIKER